MSSMVTTNKVVAQAVSSGPKSTILGDVTNLGKPSIATKPVAISHAFIPAVHLPDIVPSPVKDNEFVLIDDSEDEDEEVLDALDLFGASMEDTLEKPAIKKMAKGAYRASKNPRHVKFVKGRQAVANTKKAAAKARSVKIKKGIAAKAIQIEATVGIHGAIVAPVESAAGVSFEIAERPQKAAAPKEAQSVSFDDCVEVAPALPSLLPIPVSDNQFQVLELINEDETTPTVETPRKGIIRRVIDAVKRVVVSAKRAVAKLAKKAAKAAKNIVSL